MIARTRVGGRRLGLFGAALVLAFSGVPGIANAAPAPAPPDHGIEVMSPQEDQTLPSAPVPVRVNFGTAIQPGSFAANLNGLDVTARFSVGTDTATASLGESDGIRVSTDKNRHSNVLQVWMIAANDPSHRYHDRRAFVVKSSDLPQPVSGVIPPAGGSLESPGIGKVTFPAGAFLVDTTVTVSVSRDAVVQQVFDETAVPMFDAANRLGYEVRITTGTTQPLLDPQVTLVLPDSFRFDVTPDSEVRVLAENYWNGPNGALDTLDVLPDRFLGSDLTITATMPRYVFTDGLRTDGTFELVMLAATTPTAPTTTASGTASGTGTTPAAPVTTGEDAQPAASSAPATIQAGTCQGSSLSPPLDGQLDVTSPFGIREHPITHTLTGHGGTDLRAADGTTVNAMADGVVERVAYNYNATRKTGWGHYVVVRHSDGSKTLYAHLQDGSPVAQGTTVQAGDRIGDSDTSGGATGPHLHIEYAPNGKIYDKSSKVDPMPCIDDNVTGSITVRDNGNLADDAFMVAIDGLVVCTTSIGASNTCAVGNLRPGTKTLSLTAVIAPDNVGTYEIILGSGLTFAGGGTQRSGTIPQGGAAAYSIIVPSS